jgi:diguanylate cyclase (GGDEF)-like protein
VRWGEEARRRAITDELTGVYNRRYLDEAFKEQFALAREKQLPLAVIMSTSIISAKSNEAFGHDTGDKITMKRSGFSKGTCGRMTSGTVRR